MYVYELIQKIDKLLAHVKSCADCRKTWEECESLMADIHDHSNIQTKRVAPRMNSELEKNFELFQMTYGDSLLCSYAEDMQISDDLCRRKEATMFLHTIFSIFKLFKINRLNVSKGNQLNFKIDFIKFAKFCDSYGVQLCLL